MVQSLHPGTGPSLIPWSTVNPRQWAMRLPCLPSSGPLPPTSPSHHSCGSRLKLTKKYQLAWWVLLRSLTSSIPSVGLLHPACTAHYPLWTNLHGRREPYPESTIALWEVLHHSPSHQRRRGPCSARSMPAFMRGTLIWPVPLSFSTMWKSSLWTVFWSTRGFLLPETGKPRKAWGSTQGAFIICWLPCWAHPALLTFSLGKAIYTAHGILQASILEWLAVPFSRESYQPRDGAQVSRIAGGFFISWVTRECLFYSS